MVDCQVRPSDVTKFPIIEAMLNIPREEFVPRACRSVAYVGDHVEFASGRVLLDPRILAKMLDSLDIRPDELVLDVGCGLGYSSAVIAYLAEAVVALEDDEDMVKSATVKFAEHSIDNAIVVKGSLPNGAPEHGPYDSITVQGGVQTLPVSICDQLKEGGKIACIFMIGNVGECRVGLKHDDRIVWRTAFNADAPLMAGFEKAAEFVF